MSLKTIHFAGAALAALAISGVAAAETAPAKAAAPAKHAKHHAKHVKHVASAKNAEVEALKAQVAALTARIDAMGSLQARVDADAAAVQSAQSSAAAANAKVDAQQRVIDTLPAQVEKTVVAKTPKPKPSWADNTSVNGRMYFDFSNVTMKNAGTKAQPTGSGFDIKRFYTGVDHKFNDVFSANVTTDVTYNSGAGNVEVFVKKAYLQAKVNDLLTVRAGSADMPWIPFAEEQYGYRFVEQTVTDRTKFGNSADWGVHALGNLGPIVSYAVAVVDGGGYKNPQRSSGVDVEGRLTASMNGFTGALGGYSGKLGKDVQGAPAKHTAERFNALLGYANKKFRVGGEYFYATNWTAVTSTQTDKAEGYSVWGSFNFTPKHSVFAKFEETKPNKTTVSTKKEDYWNVGFNWEPIKIVDLALVYKHDKIQDGNMAVGEIAAPGGNLGGSGVVGTKGTFDEVGVFGQLRW